MTRCLLPHGVPPSPRNAPRTLILVKQSASSIQISVVIFLTEEPARDKSPRTDKCEDSIISCCTDRNAVIVSSADRLWWKSRLYTVIWTHICGVPLRLWHGAHRGVRIKSKRSSGWEHFCFFVWKFWEIVSALRKCLLLPAISIYLKKKTIQHASSSFLVHIFAWRRKFAAKHSSS